MSTPGTETPICPKCKNHRTRRMRRRGFFQTKLFPLLNLYPWECTACRTVFNVRNRGKLKRRRRAEGEARLPPIA